MLLRSVSHDEFQSNQLKYLTWFTACNSVDTVFEECSNCDLCIAGIPNHRIFYDTDFKIAMQMPRNLHSSAQSFARVFKVQMSLLRGVDSTTIRSVHLYISRGNLLIRDGIFELTERDANLNFTAFHATD